MESLDCLLINPPFVFPDGFYSGQRALDPPLGLMALAASVRHAGYSVRIFDCNAQFSDTDMEFEDFFRREFHLRYSHIRFIGMTTTTPTINASFRLAKACKNFFPGAKVILGGAHASFVPDESLNRAEVDFVCIGEGEDTLNALLEGKNPRQINGLAYREFENGQNHIVKNPPRSRLRNLDDLPLPAYDLLDLPMYRPIIGNFKRLPAMLMTTSRGCPWSCNFCRRPVGKTWTYRSAQSLYSEMRHLSETYGIRDITFMDDVFTVHRGRVFELCELLVRSPIDIRWKCFARVDIVTPEMLKRMKQAGCWGIMYGVENFDQDILNAIDKGIEVDQIFSAVRWAKDAGLEINVCMMVGNPGDTEKGIERNIDLVKKMSPDTLSLAILTPFPGHAIYNEMMRQDRILTYDWDVYYGSTPIVKLDTLSPEDVYRLFRKMTFSFYFRAGYIMQRLKKIRSLTELWYNFRGFLALCGFFIDRIRFVFRRRIPVAHMTAMKRDKVSRRVDTGKIRLLTSEPTPESAIS